MRLLLLILAFMAVGLIAEHEWKKAGHEMNYTLSGTVDPVQAQHDGPPAVAPSASPSATSAAIQYQEKLVANLEKQVDEKRVALANLDRQRDGAGQAMAGAGQGGAAAGQGAQSAPSTPEDVQNRLDQARATLQSLQVQKQSAIEQQNQSVLAARAGEEERRLNVELAASQLRDQILRAQAASRDLNVRLQEQRAINLNSDEQARLEAAVPAQEQRVADLEAQYRDLQLQYFNQESTSRLRESQAGAGAASVAALMDDQIRQQQAVVSKLEQDYQDSQRQHQSGIAASEALNERYMEQKREYGELSRDLETQRRALAQMKSPASG